MQYVIGLPAQPDAAASLSNAMWRHLRCFMNTRARSKGLLLLGAAPMLPERLRRQHRLQRAGSLAVALRQLQRLLAWQGAWVLHTCEPGWRHPLGGSASARTPTAPAGSALLSRCTHCSSMTMPRQACSQEDVAC